MPAPKALPVEKIALANFLPAETKLGPAMKALNERQRLFVIALLDLGGRKNHRRAAKFAGYDGDAITLKVTGHRLAHDPKVQAAILEEAKSRMQAATVAAVNFIEDVLTSTRYDVKYRMKAAQMVLDRGGLHALTEHKVDVNVNDTRAEKLLRVVALAKQLGKDPRELLGNLADVIEGDFKVLEPVGMLTQSSGGENGEGRQEREISDAEVVGAERAGYDDDRPVRGVGDSRGGDTPAGQAESGRVAGV